jgi:hypothetical protein
MNIIYDQVCASFCQISIPFWLKTVHIEETTSIFTINIKFIAQFINDMTELVRRRV